MPLDKLKVVSICKKVSENLWNIKKNNIQLILPKRNKKGGRYSEQEARFLFGAELCCNDKDIFYSVETPTEKEYRFTGEGKRRALIDMSLYETKEGKQKYNIEFKANVEGDNIKKDIEKLIRENERGIWFQVYDNINGGTLKNTFEKMTTAINETLIKYPNEINKETINLLFWFCACRKQKACFREITGKEIIAGIKGGDGIFSGLKYSKGEIKVTEQNGWEIFPER